MRAVFLLYVGPKLSKLTSPQAVALLRSLVMYFQYLALSFEIRLKWPPGLLSFFRWLRALTDGIDLAAPECVSGGWSYHLYVEILLIGLGTLFGAALVLHEISRAAPRGVKLRLEDDRSGATCMGGFRGGNERAFGLLEMFWQRCNGMKAFAVFTLNVAYIYITGVLLQAWDCFTTSDGVSMRTDPKTSCTSDTHIRFKRIATALICIIGPGVPLGYAYFIRRLRAQAKAATDAAGRTTLRRRVWVGLSDPLTRASWGGLYDMHVFPLRCIFALSYSRFPAAGTATATMAPRTTTPAAWTACTQRRRPRVSRASCTAFVRLATACACPSRRILCVPALWIHRSLLAC